MNPYQDLLPSIAANLATDLIKTAANHLAQLPMGDKQTRELADLWQNVFEKFLQSLLSESEKSVAEEIGTIFRLFIFEAEVADSLIDLALADNEPNFVILQEKFESIGFNPASLPLTFQRVIQLLIQSLRQTLIEYASREQSTLFKKFITVGIADLQKKVDLALAYLEQLTPSRSERRSLFLVPFYRNLNFFGRQSELTTLHEMLTQSNTPVGIRPTVLVGLGGIGKTQLAAEYAHTYRHAYPAGIFWLNAVNPLLFEFAAVAEKMGLAQKTTNREEAARLTWAYLDAHPDSLLIFDNVIEPRDLNNPIAEDLVPANLRCQTLFTTRQRDFPRNFQPLEVKTLPEMSAMRLLLRTRHEVLAENHPEWGLARVICASLGWLPLALELAAAYLGEYEGSLNDYLIRLRTEGKLATIDATPDEIDIPNLPTRHEAAVKATLQTQWNRLDEEDAKLLFRTAGQLPQATWINLSQLELLTGIKAEAKPGHIPQLTRALRKLYTVSLIQEMSSERLRLHPMVHEFATALSPGSFRIELARKVSTTLTDLEKLESRVVDRGVHAVLNDLRTGIWLSSGIKEGEEIRAKLLTVDRILDREARNLENWHPDQQPQYFLQQIRNRGFNLGLTELAEIAEKALLERKLGFFRERTSTGGDSSAILRTITCHRGNVHCVAVTPDGRSVVSGAADSTFKVWDLTTGQVIQTLDWEEPYVPFFRAIAITPDGYSAVSGSTDNTLKLCDLTTGHVFRTLEGHTNKIRTIAIAPKGNLAVSGSDDHTLKLWDLTTGQCFKTLTSHSKSVSAVVITPDGRFIVSGSYDNTIKVWELTTGELAFTLKAPFVFPDRSYLISEYDYNTLKIKNLATKEHFQMPKSEIDFEGLSAYTSIVGLAITSDGKSIIAISNEGFLQVWNLETGELLSAFAEGGDCAVVTTADGRFAVTGSSDCKLRIWDISKEELVGIFEGHTQSITAVAITPDDRFVISASFDHTLKVWDMKTMLANFESE